MATVSQPAPTCCANLLSLDARAPVAPRTPGRV